MVQALRVFVQNNFYDDPKMGAEGRLAVANVRTILKTAAEKYKNHTIAIRHEPRGTMQPDPHSGIHGLKHEDDEFAAFLAELFSNDVHLAKVKDENR
jgi:hypothetical protein